MHVRFETSLDDYKKKVEAMLLRNEACNNLMLGILDRLDQNGAENDCHLGLVEADDMVVYAFMQNQPNNWILPDVDQAGDDVIREAAQFIHESGLDIPGVIGPTDKADVFVHELKRLGDTPLILHMEQLIYQLDRVNPIPVTAGYLTEATANEYELIKSWLIQFGNEANETVLAEGADRMASAFIDNASLYLWVVNDKPVSMVNRSRKTKHGATINAVFTPDTYKRNGYATAAVAKLTEKLLQDGFEFCSLYTDASNPTANSVYKKIGYYVVGSSIVYKSEYKNSEDHT